MELDTSSVSNTMHIKASGRFGQGSMRSYRLTPAGDGKSCLYGMCGHMGQLLSTFVDNGASYFNAKTMLDAIEGSRGLSATTFLAYKPDWSSQLTVELSDPKYTFSTSILTIVLNSDRTCKTSTLSMAYKYTGFSNGELLTYSIFKYFKQAEEGKRSHQFFLIG